MTVRSTIATVSAEQGGVITRRQLRSLGLSDSTIRRRVVSGEWFRVIRGVYRVYPARDELDTLRSAVAALPNATVSHMSAARIHQLPTPEGPPTVSVHSQTTHTFPGVRVIRCHDLRTPHVGRVSALPVTTVPRTVMDLAGVISRALLQRIVDDAVSRRLVTLPEIRTVLNDVARQGKPGVTSMRWVLDRKTDAPIPPSVFEARFHEALRDGGIDGFEVEFPIPWDRKRRFDIAFVQERVAIELDSRRWHTQIDAFETDRQRDRECVVHGWTMLRFTWSDLNADRSDLLRTINAARRSAGGNP